LEDLADRVTEQWGIHVQIQANETFDPLHQDDRILLYRAAHELLENVGKHAQAANAHLRVSFAEGRVELQVEDDGKGFDVSAPTGKGIGLLSIKERMHSLGGEFSIKSVPGQGTLVRVAMPVLMQEDVR
jgi:signal transduction histidine kinase